MASYTAPTLHATADDLAVDDYNSVANNTTFLYQAPYILTTHNSNQSLATNSTTQVTLDVITNSNYGFSLSSSNIIFPLTGVYWVQGGCGLEANSNPGASLVSLYHNGGFILNGAPVQTDPVLQTCSIVGGLVVASAGDTVGLYVYQTIGGPASTGSGQQSTYLHAFFRGAQ